LVVNGDALHHAEIGSADDRAHAVDQRTIDFSHALNLGKMLEGGRRALERRGQTSLGLLKLAAIPKSLSENIMRDCIVFAA
jgi:hypothetical protein